MGNYRFRLSDMIPNAWFYKLKDMGRTRKNQQFINHPKKKKQQPTKTSLSSSSLSSSTTSSSSTTTHPIPIPPNQSKTEQPHVFTHQRKSYYFTRELTPPAQPPPPPPLTTHDPTFQIQNPKFSRPHFPESPRKSSKQRLGRNRASKKPQSPKLVASVSAGCGCSATVESFWTKPDSISEDYPVDSSSDVDSLFPEMVSCQCRVEENSKFDDPKLTPIVTKKLSEFESNNPIQLEEKTDNGFLSVKIVKEDTISSSKEQRRSSSVRRLSVSSPVGRVRIRTNSPRIGSRKIQIQAQSRCRRRLSESLAVVKSSVDPHRDFRESMVEMILENNIRGSKDLEDLLACYLQLNSDEYHELIIKVFKQIWFDLEDVKFKQ